MLKAVHGRAKKNITLLDWESNTRSSARLAEMLTFAPSKILRLIVEMGCLEN